MKGTLSDPIQITSFCVQKKSESRRKKETSTFLTIKREREGGYVS
jgi:hypothetical protein